MKETFGKLIENVRHEKGWSVYALARKTGLTDQAIHDLEGSDRMPTFDTARRLAVALGISLDWIASQLPPVELPEPALNRPRGRPRKAGAGPPPTPPLPAETPKRTRGKPNKGAGGRRRSPHGL
jgi:transcriptional regulator with XRE-family HTH domain